MISDQKRQVLELFSQGRKEYKLMNFEAARAVFQKALDIDPEDGPAKVYAARCRHYLENPPADDWDGVFVMKTK